MAAKAVDSEHKASPDEVQFASLESHVVKTLLGQGLLQTTLPRSSCESYDFMCIGLKSEGTDIQDPELVSGLLPRTVAVVCLRLSKPRLAPETRMP